MLIDLQEKYVKIYPGEMLRYRRNMLGFTVEIHMILQ